MELIWNKCEGGKWCGFINVNLAHDHFNNLVGVYIIWSGDYVVRLGSGIIKDRITEHRTNLDINIYENLKVSWAMVNQDNMQGVEKYLANRFQPLVGERFPDTDPIEVNSPWG